MTNPSKELPVGKLFEHGYRTVKVVKSGNCNNCVYLDNKIIPNEVDGLICKNIKCTADERKDETYVKFIPAKSIKKKP